MEPLLSHTPTRRPAPPDRRRETGSGPGDACVRGQRHLATGLIPVAKAKDALVAVGNLTLTIDSVVAATTIGLRGNKGRCVGV